MLEILNSHLVEHGFNAWVVGSMYIHVYSKTTFAQRTTIHIDGTIVTVDTDPINYFTIDLNDPDSIPKIINVLKTQT